MEKKTLEELLGLDFFIYSSHKSGTQSLVSSLINSGAKCKHIHTLDNIKLARGKFCQVLESYKLENNKKMILITVFRNPIERHISSFFQWYGSRPLIRREIKDFTDTIIYKSSIDQLHHKFITELREQSLVGFSDSLHEIFQELGICADDLKFNKERKYGVYESDIIKLYFLEHNIFFSEFKHILSEITGMKVFQDNKNMSENKFYKYIYIEFKKTLCMPNEVILNVFDSKWDLMKLFYEEDAESILSQCYINYGMGDQKNPASHL